MSDTYIPTTSTIRSCGVNLAGADIAIPRPATPHGLRAWLPALVVLIGMPLLALATTKYVLLPPMQHLFSHAEAAPQTPVKVTVNFRKVLPVPGGSAVHANMATFMLVVADQAAKDRVSCVESKLSNIAASELNVKPFSDLDLPARKALRAKLVADFNQTLGAPLVKEVYFSVYPVK